MQTKVYITGFCIYVLSRGPVRFPHSLLPIDKIEDRTESKSCRKQPVDAFLVKAEEVNDAVSDGGDAHPLAVSAVPG